MHKVLPKLRMMKFHEAIREAIEICMEDDPTVFIMGLGVPDPVGIFGTTLGLRQKFGKSRVRDMPVSENAMTGIVVGAALTGSRPILTHQRLDFAIVSLEQVINQAAKWHYTFGGVSSVPIVIRMLIGRGWGQGPQHAQSLQSFFAHVPGLKVIMPATARDAKGLMISAIEDDNPVISLEHRWLYYLEDQVPEGRYREPIGKCRILRDGTDVTIVAASYMTSEAMRAQAILADQGVSAEVIDIRTVQPFDWDTVFESVNKTGRLVVADTGSLSFGISGEIVARCAEALYGRLKAPPARVALPDSPSPSSSRLLVAYYPRAVHVADAALSLFGRRLPLSAMDDAGASPLDIPDATFKGAF